MKPITAAAALILAATAFADPGPWPSLAAPAKSVGGGARDAAVIVGIGKYDAVPPVVGAAENARDWYEYLTATRGVPAQNARLLIDGDAAREDILEAVKTAARRVGPGGTLWFVFVGHGARGADGRDGLLAGVDARPSLSSLQARSVAESELLRALARGRERDALVVLDACFSGRDEDGRELVAGLQPLMPSMGVRVPDPREAVLTAAAGDQFAGALPGEQRPAFSYLILGGLRGWAADARGVVTAEGLWSYARRALEATVRGREQSPQLWGNRRAAWASSREPGPDLARVALATAGSARAGAEAAVGDGVEIEFKDGSQLSGVLFRLDERSVGLDSSGMRTTWPRSEVARMIVRATSQQQFDDLIAKAGDDRAKLLAALDFARDRHLYTDYDRLRTRLGLPPDPASLPHAQEALRPAWSAPPVERRRRHRRGDDGAGDDGGDDGSADSGEGAPPPPAATPLGFQPQQEFAASQETAMGGELPGAILYYGGPACPGGACGGGFGAAPAMPRYSPVNEGHVPTPAMEFQRSLQNLINRNAP